MSGDYDLVLTSSTPSMQAVANANQEGRVRHVFGIVADPFSAGLGLDRADPLKHPKHMVGQSTFIPVDDAFRLMKESLPSLTNVGTAWNPAETNSRAVVGKPDRGTFLDMGLDFVEVGRLAGTLAARVLNGADPATLPIRDVLDEVPLRIVINTLTLKDLKETWRVPEQALQTATILVDEKGIHDRSETSPARPAAARPLTKLWNVDLIEYNTVVAAFARPKSRTLTLPWGVILMLAGFRSR